MCFLTSEQFDDVIYAISCNFGDHTLQLRLVSELEFQSKKNSK